MFRGCEQVHQDHQPPSDENEHEILPSILRPENADGLIDIINKLDPFEFAKLSKTCRYLNDFCWNAKGIKIPVNCVVDVDTSGFITIWTGNKKRFCHNPHNLKNLTCAPFWELAQKKTKKFRIRVELVCLRPKSFWFGEISWQFAEAKRFLRRIGCETVERLWLRVVKRQRHRVLSADLIQFIEDFGVMEFRSSTILENDDVTYLLRNMVFLHLEQDDITRFDLRQKVPTRLRIGGTLHLQQLMEILKAWARCDFDIDKWRLGMWFPHTVVEDMLNHFPSNRILGPFFRFPLPSARPLLLMEYEKFPRYLLRSDGQILGMLFRGKPGNYSIYDVYLRQLKPAYLHRKLPVFFPTVDKETDSS